MTRALRILHAIHSTSGGGAERQALLLNRELNAAGTESLLWCMRDNARAAEDPANTMIVSGLSHKQPLDTVKELRQVIQRQHTTLVHAWLPPPVTVPTMIAAFLERVPVVLSYRNRMWFRDWGRLAEFFCALVAVKGIASNNPVDQSSRPYRMLYRAKSGVTIPNATVLPQDLKNSHEGANTPGIRIMAAGRLTHQKNFETLLAALNALPESQDWRCDIYGDGEDRTKLESIRNTHRHASRITLHPFTTTLHEQMQHSDILVAPSWYEGAPNVVMEATHIGLPVLTSDIAAHRALFGCASRSWMFPPGDAQHLGSLLTGVLRDSAIPVGIKHEQSGLVEALTPVAAAAAYRTYYDAVLAREQ